MEEKKIRTISDLANLAGVSKSTVSRALSDNPLISPKQRARIRALANKNGFYRDHRAQCLSRGVSRVIGCTLCNTKESENGLPNTFQMELIYRLSSSLRKFNYYLMIINTDELEEDWPDQYYQGKMVDGFILLTLCGMDRLIDRLLKIEAPFVIFGEKPSEQEYPSVCSDNLRGSYLMVQHLIEQGHKKIGYIRGPRYSREATNREQGYRDAMNKFNLPLPFSPLPGLFHYESGFDMAKKIVTKGYDIDALAVSCDAAALGAIDYFKKNGILIPTDIAVTGFDNITTGKLHTPSLTTIDQDMETAAVKLLDNLKAHIDRSEIVNTILPVELIVRDSG